MPLTAYKRGKIWHYRGTVAGRLLRGSTGTSDRKTALRVIAEKEAREWKCGLDGPEAVLSFAQAVKLYDEAGKPTRYLPQLVAHWKNTPVKEIGSGVIKQAAMTLYPDVTPATRNRYVIVPAQAVINHCAELELCQHVRVKRFEVTTKERGYADWPWVDAFMAHASPHLGALACFMFLTGARVSEALSVRWEDVDLANRRALIRQTKVGSERWAHLPPVLVAAIANITDRKATVLKYVHRESAKASWRAAIRRAGIRPLTYHCLRHGFATAMLRAGVDPVTVAKHGGWASPAHVFATYGHAKDDPTITDLIAPSAPVAGRKAG
jgi:integrase-like protein